MTSSQMQARTSEPPVASMRAGPVERDRRGRCVRTIARVQLTKRRPLSAALPSEASAACPARGPRLRHRRRGRRSRRRRTPPATRGRAFGRRPPAHGRRAPAPSRAWRRGRRGARSPARFRPPSPPCRRRSRGVRSHRPRPAMTRPVDAVGIAVRRKRHMAGDDRDAPVPQRRHPFGRPLRFVPHLDQRRDVEAAFERAVRPCRAPVRPSRR